MVLHPVLGARARHALAGDVTQRVAWPQHRDVQRPRGGVMAHQVWLAHRQVHSQVAEPFTLAETGEGVPELSLDVHPATYDDPGAVDRQCGAELALGVAGLDRLSSGDQS